MASTVPGTTSNSQPVVPRYGHQALVVDQYMYLIGGRTAKPSSSAPPTVATSSPLSQLLRLDLSKSFAVTNPPYLTRTGDVTSTAAASSLGSLALSSCRPLGAVGADRSAVLRCMGGVDGTGQLPSSGNMADVMYFDADPKWAASNPTGLLPPPRTGHAVTFANGAYFLFGGSSAPSVAASPMAPVQSLANDMYKLNLASNVWEGVQGLGPGARAQFSMTSLRSQPNLLVAVGGVGAAGGLASMSDVWVFNSQIGTWKLYQATGTSPQPRRGHSACSIGEFIYVQGGTNAQGSVVYADMSALIYSSTTDSFRYVTLIHFDRQPFR
ncbi:hypothetical protein BC828DRAFT_271630 [Blastocladiella britannica]|nr:hypothetical protein BC828DRAFT_271630 [Blastocladiella britannica]